LSGEGEDVGAGVTRGRDGEDTVLPERAGFRLMADVLVPGVRFRDGDVRFAVERDEFGGIRAALPAPAISRELFLTNGALVSSMFSGTGSGSAAAFWVLLYMKSPIRRRPLKLGSLRASLLLSLSMARSWPSEALG